MSCNCKVAKQITYLEKKYGHNIPVSKQSQIRFRFTEFLKNLLVIFIGILFLPIMILHILFVLIFKKDKKISIKKLLRLKYVRN
jgi:fumarate reductase subunit C